MSIRGIHYLYYNLYYNLYDNYQCDNIMTETIFCRMNDNVSCLIVLYLILKWRIYLSNRIYRDNKEIA